MKYEIKGQKTVVEPKMVIGVRLNYLGKAIITGTDKDGFEWDLLVLRVDGSFHRYTGIQPETGFQVDTKGRIVETDND